MESDGKDKLVGGFRQQAAELSMPKVVVGGGDQELSGVDHCGLQDVKSRVLLAVGKLKGSVQGKITCLVGLPDVGKLSIGKNIAGASGLDFWLVG